MKNIKEINVPFWDTNIHPILGYKHTPDPPKKSEYNKEQLRITAEKRHQRLKAKVEKDQQLKNNRTC